LDNTCPYCGANNANPILRLKRAFAASEGSWSLTAILIGINVFLFLLSCVQGLEPAHGMEVAKPTGELVFRLGVQDNDAIRAGQWWRIITAMFLHLGVIHLLFNCYILWITGRYLEEEFGARLMFIIYMVSGILGFVASYFADIGGGGASGAIAGVMGAILARRWLLDGNFHHPMARYALILTLLTAAFSFMPGINHVAHGVGFIVGAGISALLSKVDVKRAGAVALLVASGICMVVTVVALGLMLLSLPRGGPSDYVSAGQCWLGEVQGLGIASSARQLEEAASCMADLPDLEDTANLARNDARRGLSVMISARNQHDVVGVREGFDILETAWKQYLDWYPEARPRYNPGYMNR
jgi:membrane associated rhomboid family serine protease